MMTDPIDVVRGALLQALIIAVPILGSGLFVGLLVSLFQSVTQIQEQTLTFVPKIIVMILVALFCWGGSPFAWATSPMRCSPVCDAGASRAASRLSPLA